MLIGGFEVKDEHLALLFLGLGSFISFFILDPFRIIEKVDLRLVRLYKFDKSKKSYVTGKKFICLVNPYSGDKEGLFQYNKVAYPLLKCAGASEVELIVTTHSGHFAEIGKQVAEDYLNGKKDAIPSGGFIVFGGDGSLTEFYNGIIEACDDNDTGLENPKVQEILKILPVGLGPVGSSNGISASANARTTYEAITRFIDGGPAKMDANQVTFYDEIEKKEKRILDLHCVSWGVITDHDELVERKWRHLGKKLKLLVAPLYVIYKRAVYTGKVSFKPVKPSEEEAKQYFYSDYSGLEDDSQIEGNKSITGSFLLVTGSNLPWAAFDCCLAPGITFDDGSLALVILRGDCTRLQLIRTFLALEDGSFAQAPWVELYKVKSFQIQADEIGSFGASGENIENTKGVKVTPFPSLCRILKK